MATRTETLLRPWNPALANSDLRIRERARTLAQSTREVLVHTVTREAQPPVVEHTIYQQQALPLKTRKTDIVTTSLIDWTKRRPIAPDVGIVDDINTVIALKPLDPFHYIPREDFTPPALRKQMEPRSIVPIYEQLSLPQAA